MRAFSRNGWRSNRGSPLVQVAFAGEDRHPQWWLNLLAEPMADAQIGSRTARVRARETSGAERDALLARFVAIDSAYAEYGERTTRVLPVVLLEPAPAA